MAKATKTTAHYVAVSRKPNERCAICSMFLPPHSCTAVQGDDISPRGWCSYFARKRATIGKGG